VRQIDPLGGDTDEGIHSERLRGYQSHLPLHEHVIHGSVCVAMRDRARLGSHELDSVRENAADNTSDTCRQIELAECGGVASGCVFAFNRIPPLDLVRSDRRVVDHDRAARGQPLADPIPIVEHLDTCTPELDFNAAGSAGLIAGRDEDPVCEQGAGRIEFSAVEAVTAVFLSCQPSADLQFAIFWGMKCAVPLMTLGGSIINLSSIGGMVGYKGTFGYAGTKWAVRGLTRSAARELAPLRIRVNTVCPGVIDTPMFYENDPALLNQFLATIPLGALGKPHDIASAVAFLASDEAAYVTGSDILVDGGMLA
jgi:NAD(P)-dependent dehydrogenase (short-subunit alcohol dehydrogenase family)